MSIPSLEHGRLTPQTRRYATGYMISCVAMGLSMPVPMLTYRYLHPHGVAAIVVAALPAVGLVAAMVFLGLWVRAEPDEYQRTVRVEAMLWATGAVFSVYTVLGFLMVYGPLGASKIGVGLLLALVFPAWLTIYSCAIGLVRRRYR